MCDDPRLTTTAVRYTEHPTSQQSEQGTALTLMLCPVSGFVIVCVICTIVLAQIQPTSAIPVPDDERDDHLTTYLHNGHTCFKCEPGTHLLRHCTSNFNLSVCVPCTPGHFQTHYTRAKRCEPCHTHCLHDDNMIGVKACSATEDLVCKCREGFYEHEIGHGIIRTCFPYTPCEPGQIVVKKGTDFIDQECGFCEPGLFAKGDNCVPCSSCSGNTTVLQPCDVTADTVCSKVQQVNDTGVEVPDEVENDTDTVKLVSIAAGIFGCGGSIILIVVIIFKRKRPPQNDDSIIQTDKSNVPLLVVRPPATATSTTTPPATATSTTTPSATATSTTASPVTADDVRKASVKRQRSRTLSDSSVVSASTQIYFSSLQDPDTWTRQIFPILQNHLTGNWKMFMRNLPGDEDYVSSIDARCEQICDDVRNDVREQIYTALREWKQAHDWPIMSVESILCSLQFIDGCEIMREKISKKATKLDEKQSEQTQNG
ncbi:tumor necrosis factor receptor superfamily member 1A-like isoform X2 [Haliotis rubra]|nr:tumor necrosis factor receptor superfamily member 1A-like isoform X2 [Haliotis rubra]XP_046564758.1 tumor necrosis factor receptor superfamily member 1A-like isoform X2 [Haliotis rubra]